MPLNRPRKRGGGGVGGSTNLEFFEFLSNDSEKSETSKLTSFKVHPPHPNLMREFSFSTKTPSRLTLGEKTESWGVSVKHVSLVPDQAEEVTGLENARAGTHLRPCHPATRYLTAPELLITQEVITLLPASFMESRWQPMSVAVFHSP